MQVKSIVGLCFGLPLFPANKFVNNIENSTGPITATTITTTSSMKTTKIAQ